MTTDTLRASIFVDFDNLERHQKEGGILNLVTRVIMLSNFQNSNLECQVRLYGGWYEGDALTRLAQNVSAEIQRDFPTVIRIPVANDKVLIARVSAELGVSLLQEPGRHLFDTFRRKGRPSNVRIQRPDAVGCTDLSCPLTLFKRLLRSGQCPSAGCAVKGSQLIFRNEQKLVDTMLCCDLIYTASIGEGSIVLVSGDDDFLPPVRTILLQGANVVIFYPKARSVDGSRYGFAGSLTERNL